MAAGALLAVDGDWCVHCRSALLRLDESEGDYLTGFCGTNLFWGV